MKTTVPTTIAPCYRCGGPVCPDRTHTGHDVCKACEPDRSCAQCGLPVEAQRLCYAIPTCYACLPPPEPLPIRPWKTLAPEEAADTERVPPMTDE